MYHLIFYPQNILRTFWPSKCWPPKELWCLIQFSCPFLTEVSVVPMLLLWCKDLDGQFFMKGWSILHEGTIYIKDNSGMEYKIVNFWGLLSLSIFSVATKSCCCPFSWSLCPYQTTNAFSFTLTKHLVLAQSDPSPMWSQTSADHTTSRPQLCAWLFAVHTTSPGQPP